MLSTTLSYFIVKGDKAFLGGSIHQKIEMLLRVNSIGNVIDTFNVSFLRTF